MNIYDNLPEDIQVKIKDKYLKMIHVECYFNLWRNKSIIRLSKYDSDIEKQHALVISHICNDIYDKYVKISNDAVYIYYNDDIRMLEDIYSEQYNMGCYFYVTYDYLIGFLKSKNVNFTKEEHFIYNYQDNYRGTHMIDPYNIYEMYLLKDMTYLYEKYKNHF